MKMIESTTEISGSGSGRTESEILEMSVMEPRRFEIFKIYNKKKDKVKPFCDNSISTSKYTFVTFLPKNLFY